MTGAGSEQGANGGNHESAAAQGGPALDAQDVQPKDAGNGSAGKSAAAPFGNDARSVFVYQVLRGYNVTVKAKGGVVWEGVFSAADGAHLVLRMARVVANPAAGAGWAPGPPSDVELIPQDDWLEVVCKDVRMGAADVGAPGAADDAGGFGTDSAISRGRGGREGRQLQRWAADSSDSGALLGLEASVPSRGGGGGSTSWDQFALNERKFGVRTDYREELYTTALDPSKSTISRAQANRIAAEIEAAARAGGSTNTHVLEERGVQVDDGGMDEEDRYGAVVRPKPGPPAPAPGRGAGAGGSRPAGAWGRGAPVPGAPTPPVPMDPRREANKLRAQMTPAGKRGSPYGTPKSPLVGDLQQMAALNLEPGAPRVDESTRRDWAAFKQQQQAGRGGGGGYVSELRQFSEAVGSKLQKTASADKEASTAAAADAAAAPAPAAPKPTLSLNPNAKSFSFNVGAKEFKPPSAPAASTTPASAGRPAGGPPGPGPSGQQGGGGYGGRGGEGEGGFDPGYGGRRRDGGGGDQRGGYGERRGGGGDRGRHHDGSRPPPPPPEGMHPPPPPPGGKSPGGGPQGMPMAGMMPMMGPMMMMPGGMPGGPQPQFYMMPGGRPGAPMFMPPGGPAYMGGRPVMMPMMPGGMPMPPNMMGMGYPPAGMHAYGGPGPGGHRGGGGGGGARGGDPGDQHRSSPHRGSPHRGSPHRGSPMSGPP